MVAGNTININKMYLYFIKCETGPIKIGKSKAPKKRLAALQHANPFKLELLLKIRETAVLNEESLHRIFSNQRIRGEWFKPSRKLILFIESLKTIKTEDYIDIDSAKAITTLPGTALLRMCVGEGFSVKKILGKTHLRYKDIKTCLCDFYYYARKYHDPTPFK